MRISSNVLKILEECWMNRWYRRRHIIEIWDNSNYHKYKFPPAQRSHRRVKSVFHGRRLNQSKWQPFSSVRKWNSGCIHVRVIQCKRIAQSGDPSHRSPSFYRVCLPAVTLQSVRARCLCCTACTASASKGSSHSIMAGSSVANRGVCPGDLFFFLFLFSFSHEDDENGRCRLNDRVFSNLICIAGTRAASPPFVDSSRGLRWKSRLVYAATVNRPS